MSSAGMSMWVIWPAIVAPPSGRLTLSPVRRTGAVRLDIEAGEERAGRVRDAAGLAGVGTPAELLLDRRSAVAVVPIWVGVAELLEDPRCDRRHERRDGQTDEPVGLDEVTEHAAEPLRCRFLARIGRLRELPWLLGVHQLVRGADVPPQRGERVVEQIALELRAVHIEGARPDPRQALFATGRRPFAAQVAVDHRNRPVQQVAEV